MEKATLKAYVDVAVRFSKEGSMRPCLITWEDGRRYKIDRIKDVRPAHAERAGGQGDRYTIVVNGKERYLFFEHATDSDGINPGKWFVERKENG